LIRWTTSAQSSRLNAVAVFVTEYWTYTVGEPADRLPLTRTIACWASSPDDFALKVSSVFWFGERVQFALRERIPSRLREPLVGVLRPLRVPTRPRWRRGRAPASPTSSGARWYLPGMRVDLGMAVEELRQQAAARPRDLADEDERRVDEGRLACAHGPPTLASRCRLGPSGLLSIAAPT
jgi:hypothetical protein